MDIYVHLSRSCSWIQIGSIVPNANAKLRTDANRCDGSLSRNADPAQLVADIHGAWESSNPLSPHRSRFRR